MNVDIESVNEEKTKNLFIGALMNGTSLRQRGALGGAKPGGPAVLGQGRSKTLDNNLSKKLSL